MKTILLLVLLLTGCAVTMSEVRPYGDGRYIVTADDHLVGYSAETMHAKTADVATKFCAERGAVMKRESESASGLGMWTMASANLIFSCVAK